MSFLDSYIGLVSNKNLKLANSIAKTVSSFENDYFQNYKFRTHDTVLLFGNIQSGKTSHVLGVTSFLADKGFGIVIFLTSNNISLQRQTLERVRNDLIDFCVCDEGDEVKFRNTCLKKPIVVVAKKDVNVLRKWTNILKSESSTVIGNPILIVDDEADALSPNTKVNRSERSAVNNILLTIKDMAAASIYLQVTGTPQALLLQTSDSGLHPDFVWFFRPGEGYIGGEYLFDGNANKNIFLTDDDEAKEIFSDEDEPENNLRIALLDHLIVSANLFLHGGKVCNFLIHPNIRKEFHIKFAEKIGSYLNEIKVGFEDNDCQSLLESRYFLIKHQKEGMCEFSQILECIRTLLSEDRVAILIMNSENYVDAEKYETGCNIIVGGNSLGRGITFPMLQTIYYCRLAKNPQADTMWQHARMFGYDRDLDLLHIFMPPRLYKMFCEINAINNQIITQLCDKGLGNRIKVIYPVGIKPTRSNVIDKRKVKQLFGGVNYFPHEPNNSDIIKLDKLLDRFVDGDYSVSLNFIDQILSEMQADKQDFDVEGFRAFIRSLLASDPLKQGMLLVRRERDIAKNTGTMLSPDDRLLGEKYGNSVVLTLYKVTGSKGWNERKLWIPNIKLPEDIVFYT